MIELAIGIIGVVLTIGFGIYSLKKMKDTTPKVELSFIKNECFSLVDESYNKLGIDIRYKDEKITNPIILLKATLRNTGSLDIDKNMMFQPLKIISPSEYKWLEAKVLTSPENANIAVNIFNPNTLNLNWDLLKEQESIVVEMVIEQINKIQDEVLSTIYFYDNIYFEHRITNLKNIRKDSYVSTFKRNNLRRFTTWLILGLVYLFIGLYSVASPSFLNTQDIVYIVQNDNSSEKLLITLKKDNYLVLENIINEGKTKLKVEDFNKNYSIKSIEVGKGKSEKIFLLRIIGIVTIIASFFLFKRSYNYMTKYRKMKNGIQHATYVSQVM